MKKISLYNRSLTYQQFKDLSMSTRQNNFNKANTSRFSNDLQPDRSNSKSKNKQLYIIRLESQVMELTNKVETQRLEINKLRQQSNCYKRICEKQKNKMHEIKEINFVKQQYQNLIEQLKKDKEKIMELVNNLSTDHQKETQQMNANINKLTITNQQLQSLSRQLAQQKRRMDLQQAKLQQEILTLRNNIEILGEQLYEKRNVERKYKLALQELKKMEEYFQEI